MRMRVGSPRHRSSAPEGQLAPFRTARSRILSLLLLCLCSSAFRDDSTSSFSPSSSLFLLNVDGSQLPIVPFPAFSASGPVFSVDSATALDVTGQGAISVSTTSFANVKGTTELTGSLPITATTFGPSLTPNSPAAQSPASFMASVYLPHEDDDPLGCEGQFRNTTETGVDLTDKIILVQRGACAFSTKAEKAVTSGAKAVLIYGCSTAPPFNCAPGLVQLAGISSPAIVPFFVAYEHGEAIRAYLAERQAFLLGPDAGNTTMAAQYPEIQMEFVATGSIHPDDLLGLQMIAADTDMSADTVSSLNGGLPSWDVMTADPCLDRVAGIWCEDGRVVKIEMPISQWRGNLGEGWGKLTALRELYINNNLFSGPIPESWCNLTSLVLLDISSQNTGNFDGFTSWPSCFGKDFTKLRVVSASNNAFTNFPVGLLESGGGASLLVLGLRFNKVPSIPAGLAAIMADGALFDFAHNELTTLPSDFAQYSSLGALQLSYNKLTSIPRAASNGSVFEGWTMLKQLALDHNQISQLPTDTFDGLYSLEVLNMESNGLSGVLPDLVNCSAIESIDFSDNHLISPVPTLNKLLNMKIVDLSHNQFNTSIVGKPEYDGDIGALLANTGGPSTTKLDFSYNNLTGRWIQGWLSLMSGLEIVNLAHNGINEIPSQLFLEGPTRVDVSHNNISVWATASSPSADFLYLDISSNPYLHISALPAWVVVRTSMLQLEGQNFLCPELSSSSNKMMQLIADASWSDYAGCSCARGTFGIPPLCFAVPSVAQINQAGAISSGEIGSAFSQLARSEGSVDDTLWSIPLSDVLEQTGGAQLLATAHDIDAPASIVGMTPEQVAANTNVTFGRLSITDQWYGDDRLTLGVFTNFVVNLTSLPSIYTLEPVIKSSSPVPTGAIRVARNGASYDVVQSSESVRYHTLHIWINTEHFDSSTDLLTIFEGDASLRGNRVASIRGDEDINATTIAPSDPYALALLQSPPYVQGNLADSIQSVLNSIRLWEVQVLTPLSTINFQSRDAAGLHFLASYTYSSSCPQGYFYDPDVDRCREHLEPYPVSMGIRAAVFATSGLAVTWVLINVGLVIYAWNGGVVRASSRVFLLIMLVLLGFLSLGSMLYAAVPSVLSAGMAGAPADPTSTSDYDTAQALCHGRVWLTALPLTGMLAVLLAKTNRVNAIFGSKKLVVRKVTDADLFKSVLILSGVSVIFLSAFSGVGMTYPEAVEGTDAYAGYAIQQCSVADGFTIWIALFLSYLMLLILAASFLAFKTRNLPSAFNESSHIFMSISLMLLFFIIIVPLDAFVQGSPEAAVLIQGVGQNVMTIMLTTMIFAPKAYHILARRGMVDQLSMVQQTTHSSVLSGKTSSGTPDVPLRMVQTISSGGHQPIKMSTIADKRSPQHHVTRLNPPSGKSNGRGSGVGLPTGTTTQSGENHSLAPSTTAGTMLTNNTISASPPFHATMTPAMAARRLSAERQAFTIDAPLVGDKAINKDDVINDTQPGAENVNDNDIINATPVTGVSSSPLSASRRASAARRRASSPPSLPLAQSAAALPGQVSESPVPTDDDDHAGRGRGIGNGNGNGKGDIGSSGEDESEGDTANRVMPIVNGSASRYQVE